MAERDKVELEQGGRTLRGIGTLLVSTARLRGGRPVAPYAEGVVAFDGPVTLADVRAMTDADLRCEMESGRRHEFSGAVVIDVTPVGSNAFRVRIEIMGR